MLKTNLISRKLLKSSVFSLAFMAGGASAFQFDMDVSNVEGFVDTTVTASMAVTTKTASPKRSSSSGRSNVFNHGGDIYSAPLSFITDAGLTMKNSWGDSGIFTRFGYLYDFVARDGANKCTNCFDGGNGGTGTLDGIPNGARTEYNKFTLYDLFVYTNFQIAGHYTSLRVGKQVVNWGESSIMGGGITQMINPQDFAKATIPGTDVKEKLLPQEMVYTNFEITPNTSLEAYYVWNWRRSEFLPVGTYFSPFDNIGQGYNPPVIAALGTTSTGTDKPSHGGQWGMALHHIIEGMNYADLGVYYVRSHAFQPFLQGNWDDRQTSPVPGFPGTSYHSVFSEDQDTFAISLNGEVGDTGVSFQTEVNLKTDFYDSRECQNSAGLAGIGNVAAGNPAGAGLTPNYPHTGGIPGCDVEANDVYTWLGDLTYSIGGGPFGADKQSYVFNNMLTWVDGQKRGDPTDKITVGGVAKQLERSPGVDQLDRLLTDFAWGYTLVAAFEYNNLFWNLNVKPSFVWIHHVEGYTSFNNGAIVENQRTVRAGVTFDYQSQMSLEFAATHWPGTNGTWADADNVSATFKYSF
ncbi:MAG: hypothetical protein DRR06_09290 [Gammaproteobacteria bacterium]|nr:MAG: hypothetical protein DRR06_09290 [Gammaproteobacteria bacterium]RLA50521.1 MAG: hypothetical protein DRR42_12925 [Gammaproteobacteria bacterium]